MSETPMDSASFVERAVSGAVRQFTQLALGYDPEFLSEMVRVLGVRGFFKWSASIDRMMKAAAQAFGEAQAQWLIGTAAMWNGCRYCSVGHTLAGNVLHFGETGTLFPLDEVEMHAMQEKRDSEILEEFRRRLETDHNKTLGLLERLYGLKYGDLVPNDEQDRLLLGIVACWDLINECSIIADQEDPHHAQPLAAVAKNRDLVARYRAAREQQRAADST